jgi:hypothetical protein
VPGVIGQVIVRQQHLGDSQFVVPRQGFIEGHQAGLPNGRAGLEFVERPRSPLESQSPHTGPHGTRSDQHDLQSGRPKGGDLGDELGDLKRIQTLLGIGQDTGPELDDQSSNVMEGGGAHGPDK